MKTYLPGLLAASAILLASTARAQVSVTDGATLQAALDGGATSITLSNSFSLTAPIYIGTVLSPTVTINGGGFTLTSTSEVFFVQSGNITISNLTLSGAAQGGNGGNGGFGGGGALGAGGAIFVGASASVTTSSVNFTNNSATGGNGGANNNSSFNSGGGGGMNGGNGGTGQGASGGGGGNGGSGGSGSQGNGGGGGLLSNGSNNPGGDPGGNGGGLLGGAGGQARFDDGSSGGLNSGGGGGASLGNGGNGSTNGGGGGGGNSANRGGSSGSYAGGGGGRNTGGNSGFGGGAGGGGTNIGGNAGFGGGGGGSSNQGGHGGVGGGDGATSGSPRNGPGGGGAGLGGAVFVQAGGSMTFTGNQTFTGNTVTAGTGANNGAATGNDIFLMTGATVTFAPGAGNAITVGASGDTGDNIADDSGNSLPGGSYHGGNGAGGALVLGSSASPSGTVTVYGNNTYVGGTTLQNGVVGVAGTSGAFGPGTITVASGSTLQLVEGIPLFNDITISGTGVGGQGALNSTGTVTVAQAFGQVTLAADASIQSTDALSTLSLSGNVNLGANTLTVGGPGETKFQGAVSGSGGVTIAANSVAFFNNQTPNSYTGTTLVQGTLILGQAVNVSVPGDLVIDGSTAEVDDIAGTSLALTTVMTLRNGGTFRFGGNSVGEFFAGINGDSVSAQIVAGPADNGIELRGTGTYTYAGQINDFPSGGTMMVIKDGSGTQEFDGASNYSGGTLLTDGLLVAGNTTALGTGLVQVFGGALTLGNGVHTLTVGSYEQTGSGVLLLSVSGAGPSATADKLHVSNIVPGQVTLGGTLAVDLTNFHAASGSGHTYTLTLVSTDASYFGQFDNFDPINQQAGITTSLIYGGTDVLLQVDGGVLTFSLVGLTSNQGGIATPINAAILAGGSASLTRLTTALAPFAGNPSSFGSALDQLSALKFHNFTSVTAFNDATFATQDMDSYLQGSRSGPHGTFTSGNGQIDASGLTVNDPNIDPSLAMVHSRMLAWNAPSTLSDLPSALLGGVDMKDTKAVREMSVSNSWNFFVRGNVIEAQGFSQADVPHFDGNSASVVLGADYRLTSNFLVGVTAGYAHTDATLDTFNSSATVDSYSPGIYAAYADHGWFANVIGRYSYNSYTSSRNIDFLHQTANGATDGNEGVANIDGGYEFHSGAWTFGPTAGLQYTHLTVNSYGESGSDANLAVGEDQSDSLRSRIGGSVRYTIRSAGVTFTPHLSASWQHEFMDASRGITSSFANFGGGNFNVRTPDTSSDSALIDTGLDAQINKSITVFGDYTVQAGQDNYFGQSLQAGVKVSF